MKRAYTKVLLLPVVMLTTIATCLIGRFLFSGFFSDDPDELEAIAGEERAVSNDAEAEVRLHPASSKAHAALAQAIENQGGYAKAITEWKVALKLNTIDRQLDHDIMDVRWAYENIKECEDHLSKW